MSDMERMIELVKRGDEWASRALTAEQQVDHLTSENARLRENEGAVTDYCRDTSDDYEAGYVARAVLYLLNPPTEGED